MQHRTAGVHQLHLHRHLADGMRGTAQARVERAYAGFNPVEHRFGHGFALDVMPRDLVHGAVHGQVVLAGRD